MDALDRHARKQLLLTRIALDRVELRHGAGQLRRAAQVPALLRAVAGGGLARSLLDAVMGAKGARGNRTATALGVAWTLLRRYRFAAALLGGAAPLLRGRSRWRRVVRLGVIGVALWSGWRALRERGRGSTSLR